MYNEKFIGIDPGKNGGIVVLDTSTGEVLYCEKMPPTPADIYELLSGYKDSTAYMEAVGYGMPGQSSKATATFARHNGHLEMALIALGIPTVMVTPARWQKHFNLTSKTAESKTAHKNRIKAFSQMRFANIKVTLATADALAIALYGMETTAKARAILKQYQ